MKLEDMTIEQKLGHVFCVRGFNHPDDLAFTLEMIEKKALGVVQVPFTDLSVVKAVKEAADYPLVIINDTEQGWPPSALPKTQLMSLGACDDDEALRVYVRAVVSESQKAGLNATWGQIADICRGDAPCSVYRKLSDDPFKVARQLEVLYTEMLKHHFLPCAKHYPGSSEDPMDTHMAEGLSYLTEQELMDFDLIPYKHLLSKKLLPTIMVNHTKYVNIDPDYPASLSKKVIGIIRRMGFDGLCYTDSFAMMGILQKFGEENVYGMAIAAGNDVVLPNFRNPMRQCFEMLKKNYEDGMISEERLNEAVRRVLKAQEFVAKQDGICPFSDADLHKLESIASDCITAVTDGVDAAIEKKPTLFIVLTENGYDPTDDNHEIQTGQWYDPARVAQAIEREFPDACIELMPEFSNQRDHNRVLTAATQYEQVVFVTFCTTTSYLGTDGLTRRTESVINALSRSGKVAAVVHFGNPFALKNIPPQKRRIYGYMMEMSQDYAMEVLSGKRNAKGKLPFVIE